jgi:hypothetical protein
MRQLALAALVFALGIAACGGADDPAPATWSGPQFPYPADGELPVDGFQAYAESVDAGWERDPAALAREFVRADGAVSVDGDRVTLLRDGLEDDSVRAERYVLSLGREGEIWRLDAARREQRCQAGRGHQEFGPALCL